MHPTKPNAGGAFPVTTFPNLAGGTLTVGGASDRWTLFVVYRGKHCPKCKTYLNSLETMKADWDAAGFDIIVTSADPEEKADDDVAEFGWTFPLGHSMTEDQMQAIGLYISDPLSPQENDRRFAEPGTFCISPEGIAQVVAISNAPAARPDLADLLAGMKFTIENNRPPRGMA